MSVEREGEVVVAGWVRSPNKGVSRDQLHAKRHDSSTSRV